MYTLILVEKWYCRERREGHWMVSLESSEKKTLQNETTQPNTEKAESSTDGNGKLFPGNSIKWWTQLGQACCWMVTHEVTEVSSAEVVLENELECFWVGEQVFMCPLNSQGHRTSCSKLRAPRIVWAVLHNSGQQWDKLQRKCSTWLF